MGTGSGGWAGSFNFINGESKLNYSTAQHTRVHSKQKQTKKHRYTSETENMDQEISSGCPKNYLEFIISKKKKNQGWSGLEKQWVLFVVVDETTSSPAHSNYAIASHPWVQSIYEKIRKCPTCCFIWVITTVTSLLANISIRLAVEKTHRTGFYVSFPSLDAAETYCKSLST